MPDIEKGLRLQLAAAQETVHALSKRMQQLESGDNQLPLQQQLQSYQQRIEEKSAALKQTENWFKLIVQHAMEAIIRLDQQGCMLWFDNCVILVKRNYSTLEEFQNE